jgi:hypothetical protein
MDIKKLTKKGLEDLGRKFGLELDRRLKKDKLAAELEEHIKSLSKDELEDIGRDQGVELDRRKSADKLIKEVAKTGIINERIDGPFTWIDRKLAKDGSIVKFGNRGLALSYGDSEGGHAAAEENYFVVKQD